MLEINLFYTFNEIIKCVQLVWSLKHLEPQLLFESKLSIFLTET